MVMCCLCNLNSFRLHHTPSAAIPVPQRVGGRGCSGGRYLQNKKSGGKQFSAFRPCLPLNTQHTYRQGRRKPFILTLDVKCCGVFFRYFSIFPFFVHALFGLYTNSPKKRRCFVRQIVTFVLTKVCFFAKIASEGILPFDFQYFETRFIFMYTKDKGNRITLRLNDAQFAFVRMNAEMLDTSPSDFLRMVINLTMATAKHYDANDSTSVQTASDEFRAEHPDDVEMLNTLQRKGGLGRANDKTNFNDIV